MLDSDAIQQSHPLSSPSPPPPPQSFPASGSFPMAHFFLSDGQSIGVSASASVFPMNIQDWFSLGWTGWISAVQGTLKSLLQHHSSKASILWCSAFFIVQLSHPYMITGKTIAFSRWALVSKVIFLRFKCYQVGHSFSFKEQASFNFMDGHHLQWFWSPRK